MIVTILCYTFTRNKSEKLTDNLIEGGYNRDRFRNRLHPWKTTTNHEPCDAVWITSPQFLAYFDEKGAVVKVINRSTIICQYIFKYHLEVYLCTTNPKNGTKKVLLHKSHILRQFLANFDKIRVFVKVSSDRITILCKIIFKIAPRSWYT